MTSSTGSDWDQKRLEIEDKCVDLIATQQPMGIDLRVIISLLHIVNELERMGDYAEGIANDKPLLTKTLFVI